MKLFYPIMPLLGLFIALSTQAVAQSINVATFAQAVEQSNGKLPYAIRTNLRNDDHIFVADPTSLGGHSYVSFNTLGHSSLTPAQIITLIRTDPDKAFPYFNANGECGQTVRVGNVFSLNINIAGYKTIENPVQVTKVNRFSFVFSTLPNHTLQGSATHGIVQDATGEFWLFQVGQGVTGEATWKQELNYTVAEKMWTQMSQNVKTLIISQPATAPNSINPNNYLFRVNNYLNTGLPIKGGDQISISATGTVTLGFWFAGDGGPEGISFNPAYNYFPNLPHGCLLARIKTPTAAPLDNWLSVGTSHTFTAPTNGILELNLNDNTPKDNVGRFCVEVAVQHLNK